MDEWGCMSCWKMEVAVKSINSPIDTVSVDGAMPPTAVFCSASGKPSLPTEHKDYCVTASDYSRQ